MADNEVMSGSKIAIVNGRKKKMAEGTTRLPSRDSAKLITCSKYSREMAREMSAISAALATPFDDTKSSWSPKAVSWLSPEASSSSTSVPRIGLREKSGLPLERDSASARQDLPKRAHNVRSVLDRHVRLLPGSQFIRHQRRHFWYLAPYFLHPQQSAAAPGPAYLDHHFHHLVLASRI
jgi:hypothetical protein